MRAILKAADLCATEPARAARLLVDGGFTPRYDYALQTLSELPYDKWREYDAEDTVRFYALRLRETGFIKSSPQKIIADGTDWRFLERAQTRAEGVSDHEREVSDADDADPTPVFDGALIGRCRRPRAPPWRWPPRGARNDDSPPRQD